jgi:NAD(P)-dependent dehydrogenase (short-subunit alcohol dehydrogenase family)
VREFLDQLDSTGVLAHVRREVSTKHEIAAVAAFLTTPEAGYVNGAVIPVDGGLTAGVGLPRN